MKQTVAVPLREARPLFAPVTGAGGRFCEDMLWLGDQAARPAGSLMELILEQGTDMAVPHQGTQHRVVLGLPTNPAGRLDRHCLLPRL